MDTSVATDVGQVLVDRFQELAELLGLLLEGSLSRVGLLYRLLPVDDLLCLLLHLCLLLLQLSEPGHQLLLFILLSDFLVPLVLCYDLVQDHLVLQYVLLHEIQAFLMSSGDRVRVQVRLEVS